MSAVGSPSAGRTNLESISDQSPLGPIQALLSFARDLLFLRLPAALFYVSISGRARLQVEGWRLHEQVDF